MASDVAASGALEISHETHSSSSNTTNRELPSASPLTGDTSDAPSEAPAVASAAGEAIEVDEIVIQPRGKLALPALHIPSASTSAAPASQRQALSIPSLDKSQKVGPQNFEKIRILGTGATGRVYLAKSIGLPTEDFYAMKVVKKSKLVKRNWVQSYAPLSTRFHLKRLTHNAIFLLRSVLQVQRILTEKQILSVANHPFVVTLHYSFQTSEYFYAKFYASEVLIALHLLGIIYRDLKPENILVHESGHIMLSDFDLAHALKSKSAIAVSPTSSFMNATGFSSSNSYTCPSPDSPTGGGDSQTLTPSNPLVCQENSLWFRVVDRKKSTISPNALPASRSPSLLSCLPFSKCLCGTPITYPMMDTESHMELSEKRTSFVGTHEYVAPETIAEEGSTQMQTLESILDLSEEICLPEEVDMSEDYKDLIRKLLAKTVSRRLQNPLQIKAHPFFHEVVWPLIRHQKPPIVPDFVHMLKESSFSSTRSTLSTTKCRTREASHRPTRPTEEILSLNNAVTPETATIISEAPLGSPLGPNSQANVTTDAPETEDENRPASNGDAVVEGESSVTVHSFDYAGGSKPGCWSSAESSRTLHQKLSEMRLATPEEELSQSQCE